MHLICENWQPDFKWSLLKQLFLALLTVVKFTNPLEREVHVCVFKSIVLGTFQNVFHLEIHQNNIFLFFLKSFLTHQNVLKILKKLV
jgi:hypothetical protein